MKLANGIGAERFDALWAKYARCGAFEAGTTFVVRAEEEGLTPAQAGAIACAAMRKVPGEGLSVTMVDGIRRVWDRRGGAAQAVAMGLTPAQAGHLVESIPEGRFV